MTDERPSRWPLAVLLAAVLCAYLRALGGELVYDDLQMIARNPEIRSLAHVPRLFTQAYWEFLGEEPGSSTSYWRPLTATVLALAHSAGGGRVQAFHAASLCVHLAAVAVAYALLLRLTRDRAAAFLAALLFGLHPLQVEGVAWISALSDPLWGLFGLLALLAFVRWRERGSRGVPLLSAFAFGLALLAKEAAVAVLPLALVVDALRPRDDLPPGRSRLLGPIAAPARAYGALAAVLLLYYLARVAVFGEPTAGLERVTTYFGVGPARLALLRLELLGGGLKLLAWPVGLNVFRPFHPALALAHPTVWGALLALLVYLVLLALSAFHGRRAEVLALATIPAALLPVLVRVASLGRFPLSDRFHYVSVLGFALYVALVVRRLLPGRPAQALLLLLAALYGVLTWQRSGVWRNEDALFRSAVAADPRSPYAHWGLGRVLLQRARSGRDPAALDEAFGVYARAMELVEEALKHPNDTDVFVSGADVLQVNLGYGFSLLLEAQADEFHDYDTPVAIFERVLERVYELRAEAEAARKQGLRVISEHLDVEQVHTALGVAHMLAGRPAEAEAAFRAALAENEAYPEAHSNYGRLLMQAGDAGRARHHFERALALRPDDYEDELLLAQALLEAGWHDAAEEHARALHDRDPGEPEALMVLAAVAAARSDARGALRWLDQALAAAPDHGYAWYRRARALLDLGEPEEATLAFRRAAELLPATFEVHYDFGAFLLSSGALEAAAPELIKAFGLSRDQDRYLQLRETLRGLALAPEQEVELAAIERAHRRPEAALEWLARALALEPANGLALLERGRAEQDLHDLPRAAETLAAAAAALPGAFVPRYELALILEKLGRRAEALTRLREAQALGPPSAWAPGERAAAARQLEQQIKELEAAGAAVGPPVGGG
jgi:protein O-mannosyl-transferase